MKFVFPNVCNERECYSEVKVNVTLNNVNVSLLVPAVP